MRLAILAIVVSCVAVVRCDEQSFLRDLSTLDLQNVVQNFFGANVDSLPAVTRSQVDDDDQTLRARAYDRKKCVADLGGIAVGLNRTKMWAMQGEYVDSVSSQKKINSFMENSF